jgi:aconitate hydratase
VKRETLETRGGKLSIFPLDQASPGRIPYSIKVLLESALRHGEEDAARRLAAWEPKASPREEVPFHPGRVVLQDFTGVPCVADLAAMRDALQAAGGDPRRVNPVVPCDLVIDHSVQVDAFGSAQALAINSRRDFERNRERYAFLRWAQKAFANFRVVPPATGIVHQVNLEFLAKVVLTRDGAAFPDSLVGTDSHTTMINGLGVLGWGVGGIEAEAVMLGLPIDMVAPDVVGVRLRGRLAEGATATDLVLTVTQMLRKHGVVDKFVEFCGVGLDALSLPDRATIANMAPEYGATVGFFPVDGETLRYLAFSGRSPEEVDLVERYCKRQGLWREVEPEFTSLLELDLSTVEPSLAGPKRPQDRVPLSAMQPTFRRALAAPVKERGYELPESALGRRVRIDLDGGAEIGHGSVVIAAITSCTNTSNPSVMIAAGLLAKKAVEAGLRVPPYVKTSLAPGSTVVTEYLNAAGLTKYLEALGFHLVGYGCTTCIGNSGPLPEPIARAIKEGSLVASAVLSGNRNFEGRIHPLVKANYLASPPLVVAYALAGTTDLDLSKEPLGLGRDGRPVRLRDVWPTLQEVRDTIARVVTPEMFRKRYADVFTGSKEWRDIPVEGGDLYEWNPKSTYIRRPPYFDVPAADPQPIRGARALVVVGDSVTTDHISPAGSIAKDGPAGRYLVEYGVPPAEFNSYGSRRGNHEVMTRGTFANVSVRNQLAPGKEGWWTVHLPTGEPTTIFDAAERYRAAGIPLVVLAGKEYGTGSSRDWAAKGPALLGVRAVIAESFERIHRSNLVGMGVLPLQFAEGRRPALTGRETFEIPMPTRPRETLTAAADGAPFEVVCRIDTPIELDVFRRGGILLHVLERLKA